MEKNLNKTNQILSSKDSNNNQKVLDISYRDNESAPLSNLFPHKFQIDGVNCISMESFIQSLRVSDEIVQKKICEGYTGYTAYKMRLSLPDWRKEGYVYWRGKKILRESLEYHRLLTKAYDKLFENEVFRYCLNMHKDDILIHSIGCKDVKETLLTPDEYIDQLEILRRKL